VRWLIDGYNVIRREPDLRAHEAESLEAGRRALLHLLARAHRAPRDEFTVVFDGARVAGGASSQGRIRTIFSRPPHTADDELMRLARQWRSGAIVVTSDRRIQDAARRAGAAALTAERFLEALETRSKGLSAGSEQRPKGLSGGTEPRRAKGLFAGTELRRSQGLSAGTEPRRAFIRPPSDQAGLEDPATKNQAGLEDPATTDPPELWAKKTSPDLPETPREKRGNPRRLSKKARRERRALGRLRQP
jgi:predicted RNA-binding protein with PIN domain